MCFCKPKHWCHGHVQTTSLNSCTPTGCQVPPPCGRVTAIATGRGGAAGRKRGSVSGQHNLRQLLIKAKTFLLDFS